MREAFPNGSRPLDFQTALGASNARNVMSSTSGDGRGDGSGQVLVGRLTGSAAGSASRGPGQGDKMVAGDSAESQT